MKTRTFCFSTCMTVALIAGGCATAEEPKAKSPETVGEESSLTGEKAASDIPEKNPNQGSIQLGPKLAKLCPMPTAYFEFDSSALSGEAKKALQSLVTCFTTGKAKGESMRIVGHADPRGEEEYNFGLGQKRAGSVAAVLIEMGLEEDRIETSSRGELDAIGTDEASWKKDRKVEILLDGDA